MVEIYWYLVSILSFNDYRKIKCMIKFIRINLSVLNLFVFILNSVI